MQLWPEIHGEDDTKSSQYCKAEVHVWVFRKEIEQQCWPSSNQHDSKEHSKLPSS